MIQLSLNSNHLERSFMAQKKAKKQKQWKVILFQLGIGALVGFAIGIGLGALFDKLQMKPTIWDFISFFLLLVVGYFLQIIIHEGGHLIFGLLSGYHFLSFRVGSITLVHLNGRWQWKRFSIQGTGGQCLMIPPEDKEQDCPYRLYNAGGVMNNFIVSILAGCLLYFWGDIKYFAFLLFGLVISGIFIFLTNGIPMQVGGVGNDGYNIFQLEKDPIAKRGWYIQLKTNALLSEGKRMKEFPFEWFEIEETADLSNPIIASLKIQQGNWYLDFGEFEKAKQCYETLMKPEIHLMDIYKRELECELLFLEIITTRNLEKIQNMYNKELKAYIKATKYYVSRKRLMYAYYKIVEKDERKAAQSLQEFEKVAKTYPNLGEIRMERDLLNLVDQIFDK